MLTFAREYEQARRGFARRVLRCMQAEPDPHHDRRAAIRELCAPFPSEWFRRFDAQGSFSRLLLRLRIAAVKLSATFNSLNGCP